MKKNIIVFAAAAGCAQILFSILKRNKEKLEKNRVSEGGAKGGARDSKKTEELSNYSFGSNNYGFFNKGNNNYGSFNVGNSNFGFFNHGNGFVGIFNKSLNKEESVLKESTVLFFNRPLKESVFEKRASLLGIKVKEKTDFLKVLESFIPKCLKGADVSFQNISERTAWWNSLTREEKKEVFQMPNFDHKTFLQTTCSLDEF